MAGVPRPVVDPRFGPAWTPIIQAQQAGKQQAAALNSGAQSTNVVDQYGNTIYIVGQLNQIVTIGATFGQPGVFVSTAFPTSGDPRLHYNAGMLVQSSTYWGTINLTAGSTSATMTVDPASSINVGTQVMIGAANVTDPSSGTPTPAITPGTAALSYTGTGPYSVTLSKNAVETGTGLYFAACLWLQVN